jgi:hypothetical protein
LLGQLTAVSTTNVSMIDNGTLLWLVDGSATGYQITLATNAFAAVVDGTGTFVGGSKVDYFDTFLLWNILDANQRPTNSFGSTLSGLLTFNSTFTAAKTSYPDPIVSLAVVRRELFLFGALKSEIWFDAGNPLFPFAELPGASIEHGCVAPFSVAQQDLDVYWLGQDLQGQGIVFRAHGYQVDRLSTHAVEFAIRQYIKGTPQTGPGTIGDAIGFTFQQGGHVFYVLSFPSGNATWVFDAASGMWHQWCWTDANGRLARHRANCHAFINGTDVVGDWQNGTLYALDDGVFTDQVAGVMGPISFIRTFPHISEGLDSSGRLVTADGKRLKFNSFIADIECGTVPLDASGAPARIGLRWSDDRGRTFGNTVLQSLGAPGQYLTEPKWLGMGIARDRVFELSYSVAAPAALNGAWVDAEVLAS